MGVARMGSNPILLLSTPVTLYRSNRSNTLQIIQLCVLHMTIDLFFFWCASQLRVTVEPYGQP